jgi:hypothetical protein
MPNKAGFCCAVDNRIVNGLELIVFSIALLWFVISTRQRKGVCMQDWCGIKLIMI